jgi:hypothetical protein
MKQTSLTGVILILLFFMATTAMAVDVATLDQVSVLMSKEKVLSILGTPDEKGTVSMGLTAEIYKLTDTPGSDPHPMLGASCVYDNDQILRAQAFIFDGRVARQSAARMKEIGFSLAEENEYSFRFLGKDDDSGLPIVVTISEQEGITTIMIFEKEFYDRILK